MKGSKLGTVLAGVNRIGLDSSVLIYHFDAEPEYVALTKRIFNRVAGGLETILSTVSVMEILVKPFKAGPNSAQAMAGWLRNNPSFTFVPASFEIAVEAARIRSRYGLKTPDALQLATSLVAGARLFLTNDNEFRAAAHKEDIKIVLLDDCRE